MPVLCCSVAAFISGLLLKIGPLMTVALTAAAPILLFLLMDGKRFVYAQLFFRSFYKLLISDFGFPTVLNYVTDILTIASLFYAVIETHKCKTKVFWGPTLIAIASFVVICFISAVSGGQSVLLSAWAIRNYFRLFAFFYSSVVLLDIDDLKIITKASALIYVLNILLGTFQGFVLNLGTDSISGLFGTESGGNAGMALLITAATTFSVFGFVNDQIRVLPVLAIVVSSCFIAAIADLKVFFIELVVLLLMVVILNKPKLKGLLVVVVFPAVLTLAITYFYSVSAEGKGFFSLDTIMDYAGSGGYSDDLTLNRFTAVSTLQSMFLHTPIRQVFGMGLGSGQYSQFFSSSLYATWGETLRWNWFTDALVFLETGWIGLVAYASIFISMSISAFKCRLIVAPEYSWLCRAAAAFSVFCLLMCVYNCVLTVEPGCYLAAFILSIPYVLAKRVTYVKQEAN